jgi:Sec-independent protein secretion pathway component TatC
LTTAKGLQLESDSIQPVQHHFDYLTQRATFGFVLVAVITAVLMTKIDLILEGMLNHLNPCDTASCLTLYEPASWSVVRWLSAVMLSIFCILPLGLYSMYSFAKPGLTQNERIVMKKWMFFSTTLAYVLLFVMFYFLIPGLYVFGDQIHNDAGLKSQYDAITLFTFALSVFWALLVTYMLAFGTITAGSLGLITENNQDWWRIRILGIGGVVLLLSLPGRWNGTNIGLLTIMVIFLEYTIARSVRRAQEIMSPKAIFDHEGARRLVTYVDCSCQGVAYPIDSSPENTGLLRYESLCTNIDEREHLIDTVARYRLTDVIIGGCDTTPLPASFQNSIQSSRCQMRGLNLLELQGAIPSTNPTLQTEMNVQIANIADPWSPNQRIEECSNRLQHSKLTSFQFIRDSQLPELKENVVRVIATDWLENEIEAFKSMQN